MCVKKSNAKDLELPNMAMETNGTAVSVIPTIDGIDAEVGHCRDTPVVSPDPL